ncbi:hypothetical protein FR760_24030 (plasmid) [Enterobacter hormaechei]|uniref:hypothetical protein n=1 Tax=Enterobacter hormaechei TaxID=158836 RepID=UPI00125DD92C|nr:hypothetical protein [Enterobacter hormaechei]QFH87906.1 hypothetical protein FR760_24030 [Enterobacter hormaechei]
MSDLQIALIAEGPTDYPIIKAALNAFMPRPFILNLLQPEPKRTEPSQPDMGSGWGGVLKWCNAYCELHDGLLDEHPLLELYDMVIIHLDVDVSTKRYSDYGPQITELSTQKSWGRLPCAQPYPPVSNTILALTQVLESWLLPMTRGSRTVLCLPAQSSGAWLAVATVPEDERMMRGDIECDLNTENKLSGAGGGVKKKFRIEKSEPAYTLHSPAITEHWAHVKAKCSQAGIFETDMLTATPP